MKITPLSTNDPWFPSVMAHGSAQVHALNDVPVEMTVEMESVHILHHGPQVRYRPYLHLVGTLSSVLPAPGHLPYGISELPFRAGTGPMVDAFYEFDDDQLADLVSKGYFGRAFTVPQAMSGIAWELPGKASFLVVAPDQEEAPPVVFMGTRERGSDVFTATTSGYELAAYFEDVSPRRQDVQASGREQAPQYSAAVTDMFADQEFEEYRGPGEVLALVAPVAEVAGTMFERLLREIEDTALPGYEALPVPVSDAESIAARVEAVLAADQDHGQEEEEERSVGSPAPEHGDAGSDGDRGTGDLFEEETEPDPDLDIGVEAIDLGTEEAGTDDLEAAQRRSRAPLRTGSQSQTPADRAGRAGPSAAGPDL